MLIKSYETTFKALGEGALLADVIASLGSMDFVLGDTDR